jgi:hypothetical protein
LLVPAAVAALLVPWRDSLPGADEALVMVLAVVAVAANGNRLAGVVAALSAGAWFDVLLTRPYGRFLIADRADVETTVLLLVVGVAVSELAVWGRRQQAEASRQAGFVAGIQEAVDAVTDDNDSAGLAIDKACRQLTQLLSLRSCRFDYGNGILGGNHPRLRGDGQVEVNGVLCDVDRYGLPTEHDIEILLVGESGYRGRFVLSAAPHSRPSTAQRLAAVALADRAATTLAQRSQRQP